VPITDILDAIPWDELREAYNAALHAGEQPRKAAKRISELADTVLDFERLISGPGGVVLELLDRPLIRAAIILGLRFTRRGEPG
jgi:hypothetical protein